MNHQTVMVKKLVLFIFLVIASVVASYHLFLYIGDSTKHNKMSIFKTNEDEKQVLDIPITVNVTDFNIFMVETNDQSKAMTLKQQCSIESAARHNPEATVYVHSLGAKITIVELMKKYTNIKWSLMNMNDVFANTPLKEWWANDKLAKHDTYYRYSHLSDAIRLALIYKNGGVYSDLDHITIKNFQPLIQYSAIVNNNPSTIIPESSFFHIKKNHEFLKVAIEEYAQNYQSNDWGANGPLLLQRCIKRYCETEKLSDVLISPMNNSSRCDIGMLPYYIAYPYAWDEAYKMFEKNSTIEITRFLNTYTIHFNSKVTSKYDLHRNDNTIIEFFMAHNCPIVYKNIGH